MAKITHPSVVSWKMVGAISALAGVVLALAPCDQVLAQIIPDGTLGAEGSLVTPDVNINGDLADRIDGGATRGANLFHSFEQFNIGDGQRVYFANPAAIENIFSRVTGTDPSDILGTLGVNGGANLFLLNPNGIIFGENAALDVRGSFLASTASSLVFGNGVEFSATNPDAPPLLTINVTPGLQYGSNHPKATIANRGNLTVGQDLTLTASYLDLQGQLQAGRDLTVLATDSLKILDSATNPFIASAGGQLLAQGGQTVDIFALNHPDSGLFSGGDMVLRSANPVGGDAHYWSRGNFRIEQLNGSLGNLFSPGDPIIRASGDVSFDSYTGASVHILAGGSVTIAGNVRITGKEAVANSIQETVKLSDGTTVVDIDGSAVPTLDVRAGTTAFGTPSITGNTVGFSTVPDTGSTGTSAHISIGNIINNGGTVFLTNQYQPNPVLSGGVTVSSIDTSSDLGGGSVFIDSKDTITANGLTLTAGLDPLNSTISGNGGDVTLLARSNITLNPGSHIISDGLLAGNIILKGGADISVIDSIIGNRNFTSLPDTTGGNIEFIAKSLSLTDEASLVASTRGRGDGGTIKINTTESVVFDSSAAFSQVMEGASGNAGKVQIDTSTLILRNGSRLETSTFGDGDAGTIAIKATELMAVEGALSPDLVAGVFSVVNSGAEGNAGGIDIETGTLTLQDGARLSTSTFGVGNAGSLTIKATESVFLEGESRYRDVSSVLSAVGRGAEGNGGGIKIETGTLTLRDGTVLNTSTLGTGNAGTILIEATESVILKGEDSTRFPSSALSVVGRDAEGKAGGIEIYTATFILRDGAFLSVDTFGDGNAGKVKIHATESVVLEGEDSQGIPSIIDSSVQRQAQGDAGGIEIETATLTLRDGGRLEVSTLGVGNAGIIAIEATESVVLEGESSRGFVSAASSSVASGAVGNAGGIEIATDSLALVNGALLFANTRGEGDAGSIKITADRVSFNGESSQEIRSGAFSAVESGAVGNAGNVEIDAGFVAVTNNAAVSANTRGEGNAGRVMLNAEILSLTNRARVDSNTSGKGNAGSVTINSETISLTNGAQVGSGTFGKGDAGRVIITANTVSLDGFPTGVFSSVQPDAEGNGGIVTFNAGTLSLTNGAGVSANTLGEGNAGKIEINTHIFEADHGSRIISDTLTSGRAGTIVIQASESFTLSGANTGVFADTQTGSTGAGGTIELDSPKITLSDGAAIVLNSQGAGKGGDLIIRGDSLTLDNQANLSAETASNTGGDITLSLDDLLLMRRDSRISTTAGTAQASGDGGNITIDAGVIAAIPDDNNDITANAFSGQGGRVTLTTQGLYNFLIRSREEIQALLGTDDLSEFDTSQLQTNDITAISQTSPTLSRIPTLNLQGIDPTGGLIELPDLVDVTRLVEQNLCLASVGSEFTITGRGGLPTPPHEPLIAEATWEDWRIDSESESTEAIPSSPVSRDSQPTTENRAKPIVEAQGWYRDAQGNVILTANPTTVTPHGTWLSSYKCQ